MCLVAMPWQAIESPSLPLGLLRSSCVAAGLPLPDTYHGGTRWAEYLMSVTGEEIGPAEYNYVAETGLFHGLGDWVFAGELHRDPEFGRETLRDYAHRRDVDTALVERMRTHAAAFVEQAAAEILARKPSLVGFSTTFMQNVPSLAVARRIKELAPATRTVFGGGNCDGPMGAALHRNYRFVDFVLRGEAEKTFPLFVETLGTGGDLAEIPGLCWWDGAEQRRNEQPRPLPAGQIPVPDFDDWFALMELSPIAEHLEPKLVLESARGCWWGEVHQCTFCGLNGTGMVFRSKAPEKLLTELRGLVERYEVLDVIMVDNIIDNSYFRDFLPKVAELDWDLRIHYEVKSNLKEAEVAALHAGRVAHVQPGIESLVSPVLKLMDKGVSGIRNVRTLRDLESKGLTVSWNWLYGFPGEDAVQYRSVLDQLPALAHLQPPAGASRILLERFSPYFEDPALGFPERTTAELYRHVYALSEEDMHDMVYLYDTPPRGLSGQDAEALHELLDAWAEAYPDSSLIRFATGDRIVILDERAGWPGAAHVIDRPELVAAYQELEHGRSLAALVKRLETRGFDLPEFELGQWIEDLLRRGLLFSESGQLLALATSDLPVKVG